MHSDETDKLPPILEKWRQAGDGWVCPEDDYFADMTARVLAEGKAPARRRWLVPRGWAVAAGMLLLALAGWWVVTTAASAPDPVITEQKTVTVDELLANVAPEELDAYVNDQIDEFSAELYYEMPLNE